MRRLRHFTSKAAFDIKGVGPKIIEKFYEEGLIKGPEDLFDLKPGDIAALERFAEKSADNVYNSIQSKKRVSLARFVYSLGILHVGEETARDLAERFGSIDDIMKASHEYIDDVPNIGGAVADSVYRYFRDAKNIGFIRRLLDAGIVIEREKAKKGGKFEGKKIAVTGTLESLSRQEVKDLIRREGGDWVSSVSKQTDMVVAGENPGTKFETAKKLGVKIVNEDEFRKIIGSEL